MRIDPIGYAVINQRSERNPRYVVSISFDGVPAVDYYITSHDDCAVPSGTPTADISYNTLEDLSGTSQQINPIRAVSTIGAMRFSVIDYQDTVTAKIKEQYGSETGDVTISDKGLRGKTVKFYVGEEGLAWSDYILVQTQVIQSVSLKDGKYKFNCADIQRTTRKIVFDPYRTTLITPLSATQTAVPVFTTTDFQTMAHGSSYTDQPNQVVGYIEIKDEVIAWKSKLSIGISNDGTDVAFSGSTMTSTTIDLSVYLPGMQLQVSGSTSNDGVYYVNTTSTNSLTITGTFVTESAGTATVFADIQFYNCTRGSLNTKAVEHTMPSPLPTAERRTKVTELIYLELPMPKLMYAILTGSLYGSADVLPSNWHLNISTDFVSTSEFINIGKDYWDITDDTAGFPTRFFAPKKGSGKKFIEEELLLLAGMFMPVLADGQLGLRRTTNILSNASPKMILDESNVIKIGALKHNMEKVYNQFDINWNYNRKEKRFTRSYTIVDGNSISRHGAAKPLVLNFQGLHGTSSTQATLITQMDAVRDRYAGPPQEITVTSMFNTNALEVGDIIRLKLDNLNDFVTGGAIDRSFEIQSVSTNWRDGTVKLSLFGSSQAAETIATTALATTLDPSFYTSAGTDISTVTTGTGTSTWTITGNSTLTGSSDMTAAGSIFYFNGDIIINNGVTLTIQNNVQLRINGDITVNGTIDGNYNGMPAPAKSTSYTYEQGAPIGAAGGIGVTQAPGRFTTTGPIVGLFINTEYTSSPEGVAVGRWTSLPRLGLINTGTTLKGLPTDLRGTSGGNGGAVFFNLFGQILAKGNFWNFITSTAIPFDFYGEKGGNGGAGLSLVAKNLFGGASGVISLNGADGVVSPAGIPATEYANGVRSSSGAGGAPGGFFIAIDGNGIADTTIVQQYEGKTPQPYATAKHIVWRLPSKGMGTNYGSGDIGLGRVTPVNLRSDFTRVQYIELNEVPEIDVPAETSKASTINVVEVGPTVSTLNQTAIEVSVSAPTGSGPYVDNYRGSRIYARKTTSDSWFDIGEVGPIGELAYSVPADGSVWEVKAHAVSTAGVESDDYISTTLTVTSTLETVIGTGNKIVTGTAPSTNGGVEISEAGVTGYDNTGTQKVDIDATTGIITATDANISGTITANAGSIGGWDITSSAISKGTGATRLELNPTTGIWTGDNVIGNAPFSVTPSGALTATNATIVGDITASTGSIGGWTINSSDITSPNGNLVLDATNNKIQATSGTNYTKLDATGLTGYDSVLGTTFRLPTDGSAPTFSSGVINSTVFNITSSGILETSSTVGDGTASGQGVRINEAGIKGYAASNATPVFTLDATDGSFTSTDADVTGVINVTNPIGVRADLNVADGADVTVDQLAGSGINMAPAQYTRFEANDTLPPMSSNAILSVTNLFSYTSPKVLQIEAISADRFAYFGTSSTDYNIPVEGGKKYIMSAYIRIDPINSPLTTNNVQFYVRRNDDAGYILTTLSVTVDGNFARYSAVVDLSANPNTTNVLLRIDNDSYSGAGNTYLQVDGLMFEEQIGTGTTPSPYVLPYDSTSRALEAGTTITGGGITLSAGGNIKGGQTAFATGTGFFLGYESVEYKFSIGDTTDYLKWSPSLGLEINTGNATKGISINGIGSENEINMTGDIFKNGVAGTSDVYVDIGINPSLGSANQVVAGFGDIGVNKALSDLSAVAADTGTGNCFTAAGWGSGATCYLGQISAGATGTVANWYNLNTSDTSTIATIQHDGLGRGFQTVLNNTSSTEIGIVVFNGGSGRCIYSGQSKTSGTGRAIEGNCASAAGWDFYASGAGTNYGPFTGAHDGLIPNATVLEVGDIILDNTKIYSRNISNTIFENILTSSASQKGVIGVVANDKEEMWNEPDEDIQTRPAALSDMPQSDYDTLTTTHKLISFNAVGEGQVNVCGEGGDLEPGDLIVSSSIPGKGMKQSDDIVRGCTVAKVRETVTFSSPTEVKMVACIYLCG